MSKKKTLIEAINQIQLNDFDKILKKIKTEYYRMAKDCQKLRSKLAKFNQATEIATKDKEIEDLWKRSLLVLTEEEAKKHKAFINKHYEKCHNSGNFIYDLTRTSLGTVTKIKCPICGEEEDITDYNW